MYVCVCEPQKSYLINYCILSSSCFSLKRLVGNNLKEMLWGRFTNDHACFLSSTICMYSVFMYCSKN